MICTYVAATVPVEKAGDVNELLESARLIGEPQDAENNPVENSKPEPFDPENVDMARVADKNGDASFERFLGSFGNPSRWAGRG